jgi:acyl dehydratase
VLDVRPSSSKPDRGIVKVHTRVYKQTGDLVAEFKRTVLIPKKNPG